MMRCWLGFAVLAAVAVAFGGRAEAQTAQLPPPAASSLDRLAQAVPPPPPAWDPYSAQAAPVFPAAQAPAPSTWAPSAISGQPGYPGYSTAAPPIMPTQGSGALAAPAYPPSASPFQQGVQQTYAQTMHVFQGVRGSWAYLYGNGEGTNLGVNELDTTATFALPFFHNSPANLNHAPLLITPGFGLQLWDGPQTSATMNADLPANTYDVFLDGAWNPQFTQLFGAELGLRVGIYTNWDVLVWESWRIMGRAIGTLRMTPTWVGKADIVYLDRNDIKLLPAVGATWTPNADSRYDIFFPAPKASRRLYTGPNRSWWGYVAGEYGGGAWTFRRNSPQYQGISPFDYNDIRVSLGAEAAPNTMTGLAGNFEVGYVFARELFYVDGPPQVQKLPSTIMFRLGLAY